MQDEFRKRSRIDSINSLKQSIVNLKSSHASLEVTSKAFKDSIAKEKEIFAHVLSMDKEFAQFVKDEDTSVSSSNETLSEPKFSVKSQITTSTALADVADTDSDYSDEAVTDEEYAASIEGVMSTESTPAITSKSSSKSRLIALRLAS